MILTCFLIHTGTHVEMLKLQKEKEASGQTEEESGNKEIKGMYHVVLLLHIKGGRLPTCIEILGWNRFAIS